MRNLYILLVCTYMCVFKCVLMCMHMYKVLNFYVMRMCVNVIPKYICMLIS